MSKLINNVTAEEIQNLRQTAINLVETLEKVNPSKGYVAQELYMVLKQCLIAEPRLKFLIEDEISEYEKLANK